MANRKSSTVSKNSKFEEMDSKKNILLKTEASPRKRGIPQHKKCVRHDTTNTYEE